MDKVDSMQQQTGNVSREIKILRKNPNKMFDIKNNITNVKNAFDGLIGRLAITEERIFELEDISI